MVVGAFPIAKLGLLAVRQVSKPLANTIKEKAKESPIFRKYVCMPPAQFYNWAEVKFKMWSMNLGTPINVPKLNEAMAIELGANLLGETIIFAIASAIVIFEYVRSSKKEAHKEEQNELEKLSLITTIAEMQFRIERQDAQLREVTRVLADLDSRSIFKRKTTEKIANYQVFNENEPNQSPAPVEKKSNYNPRDSLLFRALNFLGSQIFVDNRDMKTKGRQ